MDYRTLNPATGELVRCFDRHPDNAVDEAIRLASRAFDAWRRAAPAERSRRLVAAAEILDREAVALARLMALEMGKPLPQGEAEVLKCASGCRFFAERGEGFLAAESPEVSAGEASLRFEPLGPILAIMPWNFPFWQVFRCAAPALMAGNVVVLKHAPSTPQCALAIERLMREAGFPEGAFQNLFLSDEQAARVIADPRVRGVTLTGSTRAGKSVAATAGRNLKTTVLELGGSDPFIVLEDADLEQAVRVGVEARCQNSGQSCIAAKRFLVHSSLFKAFSELFAEAMAAQRVGDPVEPGTDIGPLAREDLRDRLAGQVERSVQLGARVLCGGRRPEGRGFFYPPTVLAELREGLPVTGEEVFGPVAALLPFDRDEEAVALANGTPYGLGASLWTKDRRRAEAMIPHIEAGSVFVNGQVRSDPRLPFGGVKDSGLGRELGREGMLEFVNRKTVWLA